MVQETCTHSYNVCYCTASDVIEPASINNLEWSIQLFYTKLATIS